MSPENQLFWVFAIFFAIYLAGAEIAYAWLILCVCLLAYSRRLKSPVLNARQILLWVIASSFFVPLVLQMAAGQYVGDVALRFIGVAGVELLLLATAFAAYSAIRNAEYFAILPLSSRRSLWSGLPLLIPVFILLWSFYRAEDLPHISQNQISLVAAVLVLSRFRNGEVFGLVIMAGLALAMKSLLILGGFISLLYVRTKVTAIIALLLFILILPNFVVQEFVGNAEYETERYTYSDSVTLNQLNLYSKGRVQRIDDAWRTQERDPNFYPTEIDIIDVIISLGLPLSLGALIPALLFFIYFSTGMPLALRAVIFVGFFLLGHGLSSYVASISLFAAHASRRGEIL